VSDKNYNPESAIGSLTSDLDYESESDDEEEKPEEDQDADHKGKSNAPIQLDIVTSGQKTICSVVHALLLLENGAVSYADTLARSY
jgi:hypothetical protein